MQHQHQQEERTERTTTKIIMMCMSLLNLLQPALHQLRRPYGNGNGKTQQQQPILSHIQIQFNMTKLLCLRHIRNQMDMDMDMDMGSLQLQDSLNSAARRPATPLIDLLQKHIICSLLSLFLLLTCSSRRSRGRGSPFITSQCLSPFLCMWKS